VDILSVTNSVLSHCYTKSLTYKHRRKTDPITLKVFVAVLMYVEASVYRCDLRTMTLLALLIPCTLFCVLTVSIGEAELSTPTSEFFLTVSGPWS